jgi:methionyl-tRNA formyltransferase
MGTPDFAAISLEQLIKDRFDICAVFTQPDKAKGRGMDVSFSPVKECALKYGIPVFQPLTLRDPELQKMICSLEADIIAVVAYGKLLPDEVIHAARFGAVNLHGSLLPKYRGAAPIQWAVLNGDNKTGVCTFYLVSEMDAGDLIYSEETEIGEMETSGDLYQRLALIGAPLLSKTLTDIASGTAPRQAQNEDEASYVQRLDKSLCPIEWNRTPREIVKWIYGLQPWPVATMNIQELTVKVFKAEYSNTISTAAPGTIISAGKNGIEVACKDGHCLYITEIQAPGKKKMSAADYLRGHPITV